MYDVVTYLVKILSLSASCCLPLGGLCFCTALANETSPIYTRVVPKVMSNFFLHANWEKQKKESAVVDGTSCCVILECLVTSIACIT